MILDKLLQLNYYTKKLSTSMRASFGVEDQFAMFVYYLNEINTTLDSLFQQLDVNAEVERLDDTLDKIASFYGLYRTLSVSYHDNTEDEDVNEDITLTNDELLLLIKATIIKNNCQGTMEEINNMYKTFDLPIFVATRDDENAAATYYIKTEVPVSDNIMHLFKAGLLSVQSMGINYNFLESNDSRYGLWDSTDSTRLWDEGWWF